VGAVTGGEAGPRERVRAGARVGLGLATAAFALAVTFGATARQEGWGILLPIVCSMVVFSGSAQFALVTALGGGGALLPAVASAALVNARFLPMGVAVAPGLRVGPVRRALVGQAIVDGSWVAAHLGGGRFDALRMVGATLPQWPAWVGGTVVGVLVAPPADVVRSFGLDVVFPAFFVVLLLDELRDSVAARWAAGLGAVLAGALVTVLPVGLALLAATPAALVGLLPRFRRQVEG
jgi:predicted branched-subunit amino acid permease